MRAVIRKSGKSESVSTESVNPEAVDRGNAPARLAKAEPQQQRTLTFDLHPLYASILQDGALVREGDVLGLDVDLRRVLAAPFAGTVRLLVTGHGAERRVKVFLSESRRPAFASGGRN